MASTFANNSQTITVSQAPGIVTVIERFDMTQDLQEKAVELAGNHISRAWSSEPGFVGAALLRCRNRGGLSCYAQWKRPSNDSPPIAPDAPPSSQSLAEALKMFRNPRFRRMDSRTYTLDFSASADGVTLPSVVSMKETPCAHFGVFAVTRDSQNRLLDLARGYGPLSLVTPGLRAINFHRSLDGKRVINLGLWAHLDAWDDLQKQSGFSGENMYWEDTVDDFQPDLFDVVAVDAVQ